MKVAIIGGGPAGLYFGYLLKRKRPDAEIRLVEQNTSDATFGFGVVFSDRALEFLRDDDPETYDHVTPHMEIWDDLTVDHDGEKVRIDGIGFAAIGRLELLKLLQERVRSVGLEPEFATQLTSFDELADYDLVVGADGINSVVRAGRSREFGVSVTPRRNKFVWYGTTKPFDTLTHTYRRSDHGPFNAHHYRYAPDRSTFIVETDPETWAKAGFADMDEADTMAYCERVFAAELDGHPLISNKSIWRNFPNVWNDAWSAGNAVLLGDALRTAHFSIGSGTRLAMEDAIALSDALVERPGDLGEALKLYEARRRPIVEKLVDAANASAAWYERFPEHMALAPWDLAHSYMRRTGRVSNERLTELAPRFMAAYAERKAQTGTMKEDR